MVVRKHRRFEFRLDETSNEEIQYLLHNGSDKAELLWYGYRLWNLVNSSFFRNICLADNTDTFYCELIVRVTQDVVYITYKETVK